MEKKNIGMKTTIVILCLLVIVLSGYIVYDKVLNKEINSDSSSDIINSPKAFINNISKVEEILKNHSEYSVNYNDVTFKAYKNDNNIIENIEILYNGNQVNKDLRGDIGFHTLNAYYIEKSGGLFVITLLTAPVAANPSTYIIAFDENGNIKLDEITSHYIYVDENKANIIYRFHMGGGYDCDCIDDNKNIYEGICSSVIGYDYFNNDIQEMYNITKKFEDLPKCQ